MSTNKQQLQLNNTDLQSILSTVLGLPTQESVKHGAYVWKKYDIKNYSVQFVRLANNQVQVVPTNITYNELTLGMLNNRVICVESTYNFIIKDGALHWIEIGSTTSSGNTSLTYDNSNGTITIGNNSFQETYEYKSFSDTYNSFIDYVVSDQSTAYPDGGTQDGYWYEKVVEGVDLLSATNYSNIAVDKFTLSSTLSSASKQINHSLGEIPKIAIVLSPLNSSNTLKVDVLGYYSSSYTQTMKMGLNNTNMQATKMQVSVGMNAKTVPIYGDASSYYQYMAGVEYTLITMA